VSQSSPTSQGRTTVLIVDDVAASVELLNVWLEDLPNADVVTATDGIEALEQVERHHPDLLLLDVMMPRLSGFEVCRRLKSDPATRDIAVIMVTALDQASDIERATDCGADDFISQPVNRIELLGRVGNLLALRQARMRHRSGQASAPPPGGATKGDER